MNATLPRLAATALCVLAVVALAPTSAAAHGEPPASNRPVEGRAELVNDVPVQIGGGLLLEHRPTRLRLRASLGVLPEAYVRLANNAVQAFEDSYTDPQADLVANTIQNSLIGRIHIGWRPVARRGFYVHAGYTVATLGGGATALALIEGITGRELEADTADATGELEFDAASTLHLIDTELGWERALWRGLTLRLSFGWSFTVASSTAVEAQFTLPGPVRERALREFERFTENYLNDTYTSYIHPPQLGIALGWAF
jgi:hypothetical protein